MKKHLYTSVEPLKYTKSIKNNKSNNYKLFINSMDKYNENKCNENKCNENKCNENKCNDNKVNNIKKIKKNDTKNDIKEEEVKKELDMFIKKVNNKYYNDFIYSTQFTGKRIEDDIVIRNENKYKNVDKNKSKNKNNKFNDISKAYLKSKQKVNIDAKIENIEDILNLINSYKCDPKIEYNINMSPLHNIKEPLEKLNNMIGMKQFKNNILDQLLYFIQD